MATIDGFSAGVTEIIRQDQPTHLPAELCVAVSLRADGTMLNRSLADRHAPEVRHNRELFCQANGIDYSQIVYQLIAYEPSSTYDVIAQVDAPHTAGVLADALYTETPEVALFLPVADCVATVVYDPTLRHLALAHLGRHGTVANTMAKLIDYMTARGSSAADILIWMAPSVKQQSYRMEYFDQADMPEWQDYCQRRDGGFYLDLQGYNTAQAVQRGIAPAHINVSPVDTATNADYFSHSQGDTDGRFAVVAMIRS